MPADTDAATASLTAELDVLRSRGAHRFDPVGFRLVEVMAQRAAAQPGAARQMLEQRLRRLITDLATRFSAAEAEARSAVLRAAERYPSAAARLREQYETGDFSAVRQRLAQLEARRDAGGLADLLTQFESKPSRDPAAASTAAPATSSLPRELKAVRHFHRTWSRLRVDQQLLDAIERAPKQAGPLNSHHLVLQALRLMRDISPDYLEQFVAHIDALLWLEQAGATSAGQKEPKRAKGTAKRSRGRR